MVTDGHSRTVLVIAPSRVVGMSAEAGAAERHEAEAASDGDLSSGPDSGTPQAAASSGPDSGPPQGSASDGDPSSGPDSGPDSGTPQAAASGGPDSGLPQDSASDGDPSSGPDTGTPQAAASSGPDSGPDSGGADTPPETGDPATSTSAEGDGGQAGTESGLVDTALEMSSSGDSDAVSAAVEGTASTGTDGGRDASESGQDAGEKRDEPEPMETDRDDGDTQIRDDSEPVETDSDSAPDDRGTVPEAVKGDTVAERISDDQVPGDADTDTGSRKPENVARKSSADSDKSEGSNRDDEEGKESAGSEVTSASNDSVKSKDSSGDVEEGKEGSVSEVSSAIKDEEGSVSTAAADDSESNQVPGLKVISAASVSVMEGEQNGEVVSPHRRRGRPRGRPPGRGFRGRGRGRGGGDWSPRGAGLPSSRDGDDVSPRRSVRAAAGKASSSIKDLITDEEQQAQKDQVEDEEMEREEEEEEEEDAEDKADTEEYEVEEVVDESKQSGVEEEGSAAAKKSGSVAAATDKPPGAATAPSSMRNVMVQLPAGTISGSTTARDSSGADKTASVTRLIPVLPKMAATMSNQPGQLLSNRYSMCFICNQVKLVKYMLMSNSSTSMGTVICSDSCLDKCMNSVKSGALTLSSLAAGASGNSALLNKASSGSAAAPGPGPAAVSTSAAGTAPTLAVSSVTSLAAAAPAPAAEARPRLASRDTICSYAKCRKQILPATKQRTVWETNVFCSPLCAIKHQKKDGVACVFCKVELQEMALGKYCVRFGSDVRQFCSNLCLDGFKKRLKVCSYCQRDITRYQGSFLAPVGAPGAHQFKEFCSQTCLTRYKTTHNETVSAVWQKCAVCLKNKPVQHRVAVLPETPAKTLCSNPCLKAYKFAIKDEGELDTCCVCKALLVVDNMAAYRVWHGTLLARLCSQSCSNVYVLTNRRIVSCRYCKVKKYNFDMMEVTSEKDGLYCSVHCLSCCGKRVSDVTSAGLPSSARECAHCKSIVSGGARYSDPRADKDVFCGRQCALAHVKEVSRPGPAVNPTPAARAVPSSNGVDPTLPRLLHRPLEPPPPPPPQEPEPEPEPPAAADSPPELVPEVPPPAPGPAGEALPTIQSVVSLAAEDPQQQGASDTTGVVLVPPPPVVRRNVCVQVQPRQADTETNTIATQTEPDLIVDDKTCVVPFPVAVPFFVPAPMAMYNMPYPVPVPFMLPVPVPLLLGRRQTGSSSKDMDAESDKPSQESQGSLPPSLELRLSATDLSDAEDTGADGGGGGGDYSSPSDDPQPPSKRRRVEAGPADGVVDLAAMMSAPPTLRRGVHYASRSIPHCTEYRGRINKSKGEAVKITYCVRAYGQFAAEQNCRPAWERPDPPLPPEARLAEPAELAAALRQLTERMTRPDGQLYPADLLHYILLGIQLYLLEGGRTDNIFWDAAYEPMNEALQRRLRPIYDTLRLAMEDPRDHVLITHVEEEQLWEAKVLGASSPFSLLTTVVYYTTKYFLLGTSEMHELLSFSMIEDSFRVRDRLGEQNLRLVDSRGVYGRKKVYEMPVNTKDPFKCPVKFLKFYLDKCDDKRRSSASPLYLKPDPFMKPDWNVWFTREPLSHTTVARVLERLLTVRELQTALLYEASS